MSLLEKREPGLAARANATTYSITSTENSTSPTRTVGNAEAFQLTLDVEAIPAHGLHPAEADLRFEMNALPRERLGWWLLTPDGQPQLEFLQRRGWAA